MFDLRSRSGRDLRSRECLASRHLRSRSVPQARTWDAIALSRTRRGRRDPSTHSVLDLRSSLVFDLRSRLVFDLRSSGFGSRHLRSRGARRVRTRGCNCAFAHPTWASGPHHALGARPPVESGVRPPVELGVRPPVERFWLAPPPVARFTAGTHTGCNCAFAHPTWASGPHHAIGARPPVELGVRPPVERFWLAPPPVARCATGTHTRCNCAFAHPTWASGPHHTLGARPPVEFGVRPPVARMFGLAPPPVAKRAAGTHTGCNCAFAHPTWASGPLHALGVRPPVEWIWLAPPPVARCTMGTHI